jgi:replication factor A1
MHKTKEQLYDQIKDIKTKVEFKKEIAELQKEYDGLFDGDTAALLIVDELGRNKENILKIADLESGIECTVLGKITNIYSSRNFNRKNGSTGKVTNLELTDETGKCGLALWDKDVELVTSKKIQIGTNIKIINGYIKDGFRGIEINAGRWGLIEINPDHMPKIKKEEKQTTIKGKLLEIQPTKAFFKDNGEFGFVTNIKIETSVGEKRITIWGKKVKEIQKLRVGSKIEIYNFDIKQNNGGDEIHLNSKCTIQKL